MKMEEVEQSAPPSAPPPAPRHTPDPILYWNDVALEANRVSHTNGAGEQTGPTLSSRALAIVHLAMYDAYVGVLNQASGKVGIPPYLPNLPVPKPGASAEAAVATAAHATLSHLFPSQKAYFDLKHAEANLPSSGVKDGRAFGSAVAKAILADRKGDPDASDLGYAPSNARGAHRVDPDNPAQGFHAPFYGARSRCFGVSKRHCLDAPPRTETKEYENALREVRGKGIAPELMGTLPEGIAARTPHETLIGIYWGYDGAAGLGTPPRLYNQIVRAVAKAKCNTVTENARLFAFVNAAMADSGILAWEQKYLHDLWRPIVGLREHDMSMGPTGQGHSSFSPDCDPSWLPLGAPKTNGFKPTEGTKNFTPPFPAYPSGHATFGAAAFHITRLFYGVAAGNRGRDDLFRGLKFVSDEFDGMNADNKGTVRPRHARHFADGLWQMIEENGRSRVYLGVHWVFDAFALDDKGKPDLRRNIGGVPLGINIAEDMFAAGGCLGPRKSTV